jgi:hypothetical protein
MTGRILVLSSDGDSSIEWLRQCFESEPAVQVIFATGDEILASACLIHEIATDRVGFRVELTDDQNIAHDAFDLVINRLTTPAQFLRHAVDEQDLAYASGEAHALLMGLFQSFTCRVLNVPKSGGVHATWCTPADWIIGAARVGLPSVQRLGALFAAGEHDAFSEPPPASSLRQLVVLGDSVYGPDCPADVRAALVHLARHAGCDLVGVTMSIAADGGWQFLSATSCPELSAGGNALGTALSAMAAE